MDSKTTVHEVKPEQKIVLARGKFFAGKRKNSKDKDKQAQCCSSKCKSS